VGHATVLIEQAGTRLLTDPLLRARLGHLSRAAPVPRPAVLEHVDAVLVSHLHADHLDGVSLRRVHAPRVLVPAGGLTWRGFDGVIGVEGLVAGERTRVGSFEVLAVPAAHDGRRLPVGGPVADPLGYVVAGDRRVYFAGDTEVFDGMRDLGPLDVALLPVAGWGPRTGPGHMNPQGAGTALRLLRPRIAIPIHWGTYIAASVVRRRAAFLARPPRAFAAAAAELAPDVEVAILEPGATLDLP
jgi:L-ascorbate metabolism protein UlaG (beta-lactamase superfamily)